MKKDSYSGYRFPPEIIHQANWLYLWFTLNLRDVEDLLAERGIAVSYVERPPRQELFQTFLQRERCGHMFLRGHRPLASMKSATQVADQKIAL